jgi:hypothetical protein
VDRTRNLPDLTRLPRPTLMNTASFGRSATAVSHGGGRRLQLRWVSLDCTASTRTTRGGMEGSANFDVKSYSNSSSESSAYSSAYSSACSRSHSFLLRLLFQLLTPLHPIPNPAPTPVPGFTQQQLRLQLHSRPTPVQVQLPLRPVQTVSSAPPHSPSLSPSRRYAVSLVFGRVHTSTSHTPRKSAKDAGERVE